jgi:uncharacterized membrane protein
MGAHKAIAWLACVVLLTPPVAAVLATPFLDACRRDSAWSVAIYLLLVILALYMLTSALLVEFFQRRSLKSAPRSVDIAPLLLLVGVGASSAVSMIGPLAVCFTNASGMQVYGWVGVSVACMLFYAWRYRRVLV